MITLTTPSKDFYFWLGMDGELESVTQEEFEKKQVTIIKEREDWLNVVSPEDTLLD